MKKNLSECIDLAVKEYTNLKDKKKALKATKKWNLPESCKIVLCKKKIQSNKASSPTSTQSRGMWKSRTRRINDAPGVCLTSSLRASTHHL